MSIQMDSLPSIMVILNEIIDNQSIIENQQINLKTLVDGICSFVHRF